MRLALNELTKEQIADKTKNYLLKEANSRFPELINQMTLVIVGSISLNVYDEFSDIDVNLLLPEGIDNSKVVKFKNYLKDNNSQVELRLARDYETLEKYLNWNDDFILGEYQNGIVIHDPTKRFSNFINKFQWYPEEIYKNKVEWLFHEITYSIFKDLEPLLKHSKSNLYLTNVLKVRLLRYFLTALRFSLKMYPIHDKKLYLHTKKVTDNTFFMDSVETLMEKENTKGIYETSKTLRDTTEKLLLEKTLIPREGIKYWLTYTTKDKNKILFE